MIKILKSADWSNLPGLQAQLKMTPPTRKSEIESIISKTNFQNSSVLLLIFEQNNCWKTILIRRASDHSPHSGQMALPGGRYETHDIHIQNTALRETFEEIGIPKEYIEILGELSPVFIPISNHKVVPFVGFLKQLPELVLDKNEVDEVFFIPINDLLNQENIKNEWMNIRNIQIKVPYYLIQNQVIWGATAMILSEFLELLSTSNSQ
jgi:8-oxo-dGTP pyrophosphatase MutT (NUDIX family)